MKRYRHKNAIIHIRGEVNQEKLEEATIKFLKKADRCRRNKLKEKNRYGNTDSSRIINKK